MRNSKARLGLSLLMGSVSLVAMSAFAAPAMAQDQAAAQSGEKEVVVVGVRRALKSAQQIKRDADTIVDTITATDIGAFPDKSVAEALQRVAGITVSRYAAADDTAHFSAEPSGLLVRGLPQIRSEFNGRDVFSANSSRGLGWSDVSPELMAGVDSYKNQTADMIEGGIAGSINLRTRLPFDSKSRVLALSVDAAYGDLAKKWEPSVSGIYSDRFDTSLGEFGVMANLAFSRVMTGANVIQYGRMGIFCTDNPGADLSKCSDNQFDLDNADTDHNFAYLPSNLTYRDQQYERERKGIALAGQWQNHDHTMLATLQYNDSKYDNQMREHAVGYGAFGLWAQPLGYQVTDSGTVAPLEGNDDLVFGSDGVFQSGTLTGSHGWFGAADTLSENAGAWWGGNASNVALNDQGKNYYNSCQANAVFKCTSSRQGLGVTSTSRYSHNVQETADTAFNFKWDVNDKIRTQFEVQYVKASVENYDISVDINSFANAYADATGKYPTVVFSAPTNINESANGLSNPANYFYNDVMDHAEDSEGTEWASRADLEYLFDDGGWMNKLRVGVRVSDRDQHVNWSTYNWKNIANNYSCNAGYYNITIESSRTWQCTDSGHPGAADMRTFSGYAPGIYQMGSFGDGLMRQDGLMNQSMFPFVSQSIIESRQGLIDVLSQGVLDAKATGLGALNEAGVGSHVGSWVPLCQRTQNAAGSCYTPAEIMEIREKTQAAYLMLKFGGNDKTLWGIPVSGNIGVRYVHTQDISTGGGIKYPDVFEYTQNNCDSSLTSLQAANATATDNYAVALNCIGRHSLADSGGTHAGNPLKADYFSDGAIVGDDPLFPAVVKANHDNWLPSVNVKFDVTDTWVLRIAASRAMSRPDLGLLKNYFYVTRAPITARDFPLDNSNPNVVYGTGEIFEGGNNVSDGDKATPTSCKVGKPCSYKFQYTASAGNPNLKPTTADQIDISLENYFSSVGSFSFDLFYKKFHDYIQNGARQHVSLTHNGVTRDVLVTGPVNGDGASIKGFEVAYQRFFDFLPAPFDGLGMQANYTKVVNSGITNAGLRTNFSGGSGLGTGGGGNAAQFDSIDPGALEGVSEDSYNFIAMYEKGPWALRAAYNWRSKFLVTASDCCVGFPVWQKDAGYLDASIRYKVNDNIEVSLQGSNLLKTDTVLLQQVDQRFTLLPNEWAQQDRRVQVGVRLKY